MKAQTLTKVLLAVIVCCPAVAAVLFITVNRPQPSGFEPFASLADTSKRHSLYVLGNTDVGILHGNIYALNSAKDLTNAAIAVSAKFNLGEPFHAESANSKLLEKLGQERKRELDTAFETLKLRHEGERVWVDRLPEQWRVEGRRIYLLAGIPAKPKETAEPLSVQAAKPALITDLAQTLCQRAEADGVKHVAMTYIGTGAAAVDEGLATEAILRGVNRAATRGHAPSLVTVVLYSHDKGSEEAERLAWLAEKALLFDAAVKGRDGYSIGQYRHTKYALAQLMLLVASPCVAGLLALRSERLGRRMWWGPIAHNVFKWSLLATGFFAAAQDSLPQITPLATMPFVVLMAGAFVAPLWDWNNIRKLREIPRSP